jgi:hypothetical protein
MTSRRCVTLLATVIAAVDCAQDMFFVLMENSPSGHTHVQVNLKRIIYDAFEK